MAAPTLAMAELWLRLFAAVLGPLCLCWLLHWEIAGRGQSGSGGGQNGAIAVSLVGLASAGVLATDSLYVYEYGRHFGATLFCVTSILVLRCAFSRGLWSGWLCADFPLSVCWKNTTLCPLHGCTHDMNHASK